MSTNKTIDVAKTGANIKRLCAERGVKVSDLVYGIHISAPAIYKWLNGESIPSLDNMIQLADLLGVTIDEIVITSDDNSEVGE